MKWDYSSKTISRLTNFNKFPIQIKKEFNKINVNAINFHCKYAIAKLPTIFKWKIIQFFQKKRVPLIAAIASFKNVHYFIDNKKGIIIIKSSLTIRELIKLQKQNSFVPVWEILGFFFSYIYQYILRNQEYYKTVCQLELNEVAYILFIYSRGQKEPIELNLAKLFSAKPRHWEEKPELVQYSNNVKVNWELYNQENIISKEIQKYTRLKKNIKKFSKFPFILPDLPKNIAYIKLIEFLEYSKRYCVYKPEPLNQEELQSQTNFTKPYAYEVYEKTNENKNLQKQSEKPIRYYKKLWQQSNKKSWHGDSIINHPELEIWNKQLLTKYYGSKDIYKYGTFELRFTFKLLAKTKKLNRYNLKIRSKNINLELWLINRLLFYKYNKKKKKLQLESYTALKYLRNFHVTNPLINCYLPWREIKIFDKRATKLCEDRNLSLEKLFKLPIIQK